MHILEFLAFLFTYASLIISFINFVSVRRPQYSVAFTHPVTIIVPMRNEEANVQGCLQSLADQIEVQKMKVIVVDDASEDSTRAIAEAFAKGDSRFSVISAEPKPDGWIGKVNALQSGFLRSDGSYIVSIDADVRLRNDALKKSLHTLEALNLDFISVYPRQIALSFAEKLVQPLLRWSWMSSVLLRAAEALQHPSTAVANGQFFIVKSSSLNAIGGYSSVSTDVIDDMALARKLIRNRYRGTVLEGSDIASTRMYKNFNEIRDGYGKSLWTAFGNSIGAVAVMCVVFISGILPLLLALTGSAIGLLTLGFIISTRLMSAYRGGDSLLSALLHPISSALLIYLIAYSLFNRDHITWKGRTL